MKTRVHPLTDRFDITKKATWNSSMKINLAYFRTLRAKYHLCDDSSFRSTIFFFNEIFQVLQRLQIIQHHLHQQSQFLRLRQGFLNFQGGVGNLKKSPVDQGTDECQ